MKRAWLYDIDKINKFSGLLKVDLPYNLWMKRKLLNDVGYTLEV